MTQTLIAGLYIIKTDEDGKLLIFLPQPEGKKERPIILYDGGKHALLVRNPGQSVILDHISPEIRQTLTNTDNAIIVEVRGQEIADHYETVLRHTEKIPVDWSKYGL